MTILEEKIDCIFKKIEKELEEKELQEKEVVVEEGVEEVVVEKEVAGFNIIEAIKRELLLLGQWRSAYDQWEKHKFDIDHLFKIYRTLPMNSLAYYTTALNIAADNGCIKVVEHLLKAGAKVNKRDAGGYTAMHCAASKGHVDIVLLLKNHGACTHAKSSLLKKQPYDFALVNNCIKVVEVLKKELDKTEKCIKVLNIRYKKIESNRKELDKKYNKELYKDLAKGTIIIIAGIVVPAVVVPKFGYSGCQLWQLVL